MVDWRNINGKTKIDYYSRLSLCGKNDCNTETNTDNKSVQQIVDEMKVIIDNAGNE